MQRAALEEALARVAHGPQGEAPAAIGRIPAEIERLVLGWSEPEELRAGEVAVAQTAALGPAYALKDAILAHPDAYPAVLCERLGMEAARAALKPGRSTLRKLAVFVPRTHLASVRDAIAAAGAGAIGEYRDCTFSSEGIGTFLPLEGAHPAIGAVGRRAEVEEARLESVFPAYRTTFVLQALLGSHPYEEPAYDVYDLRNPEPTYGAARLGTLQPRTTGQLAQEVRGATGAKNIRWIPGNRADVSRILVLGDPRLARHAREENVDAVVSPPLLAWDVASLQSSRCALIEVEDFLERALRHFADRLRAMTHLEVRFAPEGFTWRRLRSRDGTIPS